MARRHACGAVLLVGLVAVVWLPTAAAQQAERRLTTAQVLERARAAFEQAIEQRDAELVTQATEVVREVLQRDPGNIEAHLLAGEISLDVAKLDPRLADFDSARNHFMMVLEAEPNNYRANLGVGRIWNANRVWRQAVAFLEKAEAVAATPEQAIDVKREMAIAFAGMGNKTRAIEKAAEAVQLDADDLEALRTLTEIRLSAATTDPERYLDQALADAELYLNKCREEAARNPTDREKLVELNEAFDLLLAAVREHHTTLYERDIRQQPTDKLLLGKEPEAAAALLRMAELMREQALVRLTLTEHENLVLVEKAVEYQPENVRYLEALAVLYQRIHDRENAIATSQRILELDPDHEGARQFLESVGAPLSAPEPSPADAEGEPSGD